jgi:hypothetical protein
MGSGNGTGSAGGSGGGLASPVDNGSSSIPPQLANDLGGPGAAGGSGGPQASNDGGTQQAGNDGGTQQAGNDGAAQQAAGGGAFPGGTPQTTADTAQSNSQNSMQNSMQNVAPGTAPQGNVSPGAGYNPGGLPNLDTPGLAQAYQYPISGSAKSNPERIDQGVDFGGQGTYNAIGDSKVVGIQNSGWPGGPYMQMQLTSGPLKGQNYYVAEGIQPLAGVGQTVKKGQPLARITGGSTGIETGWASKTVGLTLSHQLTGHGGGQEGAAGKSFSTFLNKLGGPGGVQAKSSTAPGTG